MDIVLATTSPYRKEAFAFLKIPFSVEGSQIDEEQFRFNDPEEMVAELARQKATAVAAQHKEAIVIGFDSSGYFEGAILNKPKSRKEAFERLTRMSGKSYEFFTGIYMMHTETKKTLSRIVKTIAWFRNLSKKDIEVYLDEDELYKTHATGVNMLNHYSASFVSRIEGNPHSLLSGIPLDVVLEMLNEFGYN